VIVSEILALRKIVINLLYGDPPTEIWFFQVISSAFGLEKSSWMAAIRTRRTGAWSTAVCQTSGQ